MKKYAVIWSVVVGLAGCSALLPTQEAVTATSWNDFASARRIFDEIIPHQTTAEDLKKVGLDPYLNPNVAILNYVDLTRRLFSDGVRAADYHDSALSACLMDKQRCYAYEIDLKHIDRKRQGNFWADFFGFRRMTVITGWRFNAIFIMNDKAVVYKNWSGQPTIYEIEKERKPLGPFQNLGDSILRSR